MPARVWHGVTLGSVAALVLALGVVVSPATASARSGVAPGAPGAASDWVTGDKDGFGTARGTTSKVWYTLNNGELSEIYYPRIDTPSTRDTQLVITDGRTFTDRESTDTVHQVRLLDPQSLLYQQIDRAKSGKYLITKTYITDPARSTVLVDIDFRSLTGDAYQVYVLHDPALTMTGDDDTGSTHGGALVATDGTTSDAVIPSRGFTKTSSGYQGTSDGWTDLATDHQMDWTYTAPQPGNVRANRPDKPERTHRPTALHPRDRFRDDNLRGGVDGTRIAGFGIYRRAAGIRSRMASISRDAQTGPAIVGAVDD